MLRFFLTEFEKGAMVAAFFFVFGVARPILAYAIGRADGDIGAEIGECIEGKEEKETRADEKRPVAALRGGQIIAQREIKSPYRIEIARSIAPMRLPLRVHLVNRVGKKGARTPKTEAQVGIKAPAHLLTGRPVASEHPIAMQIGVIVHQKLPRNVLFFKSAAYNPYFFFANFFLDGAQRIIQL